MACAPFSLVANFHHSVSFTALVFVYSFFPGAETLLQRHFSPAPNVPFQQGNRGSHHPLWTPKHKYVAPAPAQRVLPERLLWNYIIQLTGAIRCVHSIDLACRVIDPSKILLIGNSRYFLHFVLKTYSNSILFPITQVKGVKDVKGPLQ